MESREVDKFANVCVPLLIKLLEGDGGIKVLRDDNLIKPCLLLNPRISKNSIYLHVPACISKKACISSM